MIFLPVLFVAYAVFLAATAVLTVSGEFQSWLAGRLAVRVGLGVPADLEAVLKKRVRLRTLGYSLGGLVGMVVAVGAVGAAMRAGLLPAPQWTARHFSASLAVAAYGVIAITATGSGLGVAWAALRAEAAPPDAPRVARSRAVDVADFVPPILRQASWPLLGLACATVAVVAVTTGLTVWLIPSICLVVVGAAGLATFEVVSRRMVSRGRPVSGTDELVWDDALRSEALRDVLYSPLWCVMFGAWWSLVVGPDNSFAAPVAFLPATFGMLGLVAYAQIFRRTRTYYLQRLWPGARRRTPEEEASRIAQVYAS